MPIQINTVVAERRIERLASKMPGHPSKTRLVLEIVDRASQMSADELLRWLRPTATAPTPEPAES